MSYIFCCMNAVMCGLLASNSFTLTGRSYMVLFSLTPLLVFNSGKSLLEGFLSWILFGIIFSLGVFYWILNVPGYTYFHHGLLAVHLGTNYGLFGVLICLTSRRYSLLAALLVTPLAWVSMEYIRSNFFFLILSRWSWHKSCPT